MKNQTKKTPVPLQDITLRDFFAVFAMQAILSRENLTGLPKQVSEDAYWMADEMMEARK
ncbi:MAG: hypothetical protein ACOVKL_07955 [Polynucleobacter sp.]